MTWLGFALVSVILLAVANLVQRLIVRGRTTDPLLVAVVFQFCGAILAGLVALQGGFSAQQFYPVWPNLLLMGFLYGCGTLLLFSAFHVSSASSVAILTASRALWTILTAILLLHEPFSTQKFFGTLLIFVSIALVTLSRRRLRPSIGHLYSLGAAVCYGMAFTNDAYLLQRVNLNDYLFLGFFFPGLAMLVVRPKTVVELMSKPFTINVVELFFLAILNLSAVFSIFQSYKTGGLAVQIAPIQQSVVILTIILGAFFLRERENLIRKSFAAICVMIGVLLVT